MNLWKRFDWNSSISIYSKYVISGLIYEKSKLHSQNAIKEWIQYTQRREKTQYLNSENNPLFLQEYNWYLDGDYSLLIPHWLTLMWLIDMDFYNNRDDHCYAIQYNERFQQMHDPTWRFHKISIDSIAKLSPIIQCVSVIVPFGFYRIDCMILSIDWILSMNHSIDYLSLMIGKYLKNTNHE